MLQQLFLFGAANFLGNVLFLFYFLQRLLAKKTNLLPVTVILDLIWCGAAFFSFLLLSIYFAGGQFHFFALCGTLAGFFSMFMTPDLVKTVLAKLKKRSAEKKTGADFKTVNAPAIKTDLKSQIDMFNKKNMKAEDVKKELIKKKEETNINESAEFAQKIAAFNARNAKVKEPEKRKEKAIKESKIKNKIDPENEKRLLSDVKKPPRPKKYIPPKIKKQKLV